MIFRFRQTDLPRHVKPRPQDTPLQDPSPLFRHLQVSSALMVASTHVHGSEADPAMGPNLVCQGMKTCIRTA